jgi:hypothetical protein
LLVAEALDTVGVALEASDRGLAMGPSFDFIDSDLEERNTCKAASLIRSDTGTSDFFCNISSSSEPLSKAFFDSLIPAPLPRELRGGSCVDLRILFYRSPTNRHS